MDALVEITIAHGLDDPKDQRRWTGWREIGFTYGRDKSRLLDAGTKRD
jgi:hypothetical protein